MTDVNETDLGNILKNSTGITVVEFYSTWCGPCKVLAPILDEMEKEFSGKMLFVKADIEQCMEIAKSNELVSVPTVLIFKGGKKLGTIRGLREKKTYQSEFTKVLENK